MNVPVASEQHRRADRYWRDRVPAARIAWCRLSLDDLIQSKGEVDRLVNLIEEHYGVMRQDAMYQVSSFFRRHCILR
jgi:hypothetical protein